MISGTYPDADEVADYFVYMGAMHGYVDAPHVHINTRA